MSLTPVVDLAYLQRRFGAVRVVQVFDNDGDGVADTTKLTEAIAEATSKVFNFIRRGWSTAGAETLLADPVVKGVTGDLVMSVAMKGRPEFIDNSGKNPWTGHLSAEARKTLEDAANAVIRLEGEENAGVTAHVGGTVHKPDPVFVFAPTNSVPNPGGGY